MLRSVIILRILILKLLFGIYIAYACDLRSINSCMNILNNHSDVTISDIPADTINEGIATIPSADRLKSLCGSLSTFKRCYDPKAEKCADDILFSMTLGTIEDTLNFLCIDGFQDVMRHNSCWKQSEVTAGTTQCHSSQTDMILQLRLSSTSMSAAEQSANWCRILSNTTACMSESVEGLCGPQPACVMRTMMTRALSGLSSLMKCPELTPCLLSISGDIEVTKEETTIVVNNTQHAVNVAVSKDNTQIFVLLFVMCLLFVQINCVS